MWAGASSWHSVRQLWHFTRVHLLHAAVLMIGLSAVTGLVGAGTGVVVMVGGRLMAGLFGHGVHSINPQLVPREAVPHTMAALVGGGVVFALALVLPTLVYLRGVCEIYLALQSRDVQDGVSA